MKWPFGRAARRRRILRQHRIADADWAQALAAVAPARRLTAGDQQRLRELVLLFLHEKTFLSGGGLELTGTMKLVIALQACVLILNLGLDAYRPWHSIIVHPDQFKTHEQYEDELGIVTIDDDARSGEAWPEGPVVLSWRDVVSGTEDGINLVIHEFAHKLDMLDGDASGMPPLHPGMDRDAWQRDFTAAFASFGRRVVSGRPTRLDPYAAEDPAEFFAVVSEVFFEEPELVQREFPRVYAHLAAFYRQDPLRAVSSA